MAKVGECYWQNGYYNSEIWHSPLKLLRLSQKIETDFSTSDRFFHFSGSSGSLSSRGSVTERSLIIWAWDMAEIHPKDHQPLEQKMQKAGEDRGIRNNPKHCWKTTINMNMVLASRKYALSHSGCQKKNIVVQLFKTTRTPGSLQLRST